MWDVDQVEAIDLTLILIRDLSTVTDLDAH